MKFNKELLSYGHFTIDDIECTFIELTIGSHNEFIDNPLIETKVREYFSTELKLIKKYRKYIESWKEGTLDNFITEVKNKNLSIIDTIVMILETYFKDLMD
ncbi:MAG: hypothetical protein NTZ33_05115 [Bacteroidetes bacterium]|nr:hypothetical protein [Bacteroidota bacterium]